MISYAELQLYYSFYFHEHQGAINLAYMQELADDIETSLAQLVLTAAQQNELHLMLHKVRSFIAYGKTCLRPNAAGHYVSATKIQLCEVILIKMKELDYHRIELTKSQNSRAEYSEQELFAALNKIILATTVASLRKYLRMFPSVNVNTTDMCHKFNAELVHVHVPIKALQSMI